MTIITCLVISEAMLKDGEQFSDEDDEIQFEELHQLYTTNHLIIKEFAQYLNENLLFPNILDYDDYQDGVGVGGNLGYPSNAYNQNSKKFLTLKEF